jgi:hypothetical protein
MNIKNINFGFVFQLVAILSLIIIYIFQWGVMITNPALRTGTDFIIFYSAGKVAQEHGSENTYQVLLQQNVQEELLGFPLADKQLLVYNHIPYLIPILSILVTENYVASFILWTVLMIGITSIAILLLANTLQFEKGHLLFFISSILFFPLFQSFLLGQDTALLFLACVLWSSGMIKQKSWLAAIGLALLSIRPHLCLVFAIPVFLFESNIRWKFVLCISFLISVSIGLLGWNGVFDYIHMLQISASGTWYGFHQNAMFNFIGLAARSLPFLDANFIRIIGWLGYFSAIIFLSTVWRQKSKDMNWLVSITILFSLFFAPHLYYHDLTLLIIPFVLLLGSYKNFSTILLAVSFVLVIFKPFHYILPYFVYAGLLWRLKNQTWHYN